MYSRTRNQIEKLRKEGLFPGASYGFIEGDQVEHYQTGVAAVYPKTEAIQENQLYDVASLTKVMMTTMVILQLLEEKIIAIDDPVQKHLPQYSVPEVTIRHLVTHTSDIKGYIANRDALPAKDLKRALMDLPAGEQLGRAVVYTDTGFILLGFMIEAIEQETLTTVFEKRVIQPLGLTETTFFPTNRSLCAPTEWHPKRGLIRGEVHDPKAYVLKEHCGSAGLFSSLKDCLSFAQMVLNKGILNGVRILQEETITGLARDWTPTGTLNRSLGWDLKDTSSHLLLFHTGFTGTFMLLDVQQQAAFVFLSNRVHPNSNTPIYLEKRDQLIETYLMEKSSS